MTFTDAERSTIANALRTARDRYTAHCNSLNPPASAQGMSNAERNGYTRLAAQFDSQAVEAERLANRFDYEEGE